MKEKISKENIIATSLIGFLVIAIIALSIIVKGTKAATPAYPPEDVVETLAATMIREIGCGGTGSEEKAKEAFVYQMIWVNTVVNQYNFWFESRKTPSTVVFNSNNLCDILSRGGRGGSYNPEYCNLTISAVEKTQGSCKDYEREQLKQAVRMVLTKSFNIPKNIYYAAQRWVAEKKDSSGQLTNELFTCYKPLVGGKPLHTDTEKDVCFSTQEGEKIYSTDLYGNTVSKSFSFYQNLANCLYEHPNLYGAYNSCTSSTQNPEPKEYTVYLYPNGGTGITEGQKFTYTGTTSFDKFPKVTKTNCTLDGWNLDSPDGKEYYQNIDSTDNGKKLYARWNCETASDTKYTVTFKIDDETTETFYTTKVTSGSKVSKPSTNPTMYGYEFQGWKTSDGKDFDFNTKITSNITLYAKWDIIGNTEAPEPKGNPTTDNSITNNTPNNQQVSENASTGSFEIIIMLLLIIPSLIGIAYYYKYYINANINS